VVKELVDEPDDVARDPDYEDDEVSLISGTTSQWLYRT